MLENIRTYLYLGKLDTKRRGIKWENRNLSEKDESGRERGEYVGDWWGLWVGK